MWSSWLRGNFSGGAGPGGVDSDTLQGWIIKFGETEKSFVLALKVSWNVCPIIYVYGHLIALDNKPGVRPVSVRETWRQLFAKCFLEVTGPEATHACKDYQLCTVFKSLIDGAVHGVQSIWDANSTVVIGYFYLLTRKPYLMRLIESGCCGPYAIYERLLVTK